MSRRLREPRRLLQVLIGPRQTGKTTLARQVMDGLRLPSHYATADEPALKGREWLEQQWETGRALVRRRAGNPRPALLVLDEIQKIPGWSETAKRLWDEDSGTHLPLQVMILGSSALLVQRGLSDSLTGRYEVIYITHWSFGEMRKAFGMDLDSFLRFGGYPGAAPLVRDAQRWRRYILDSLIEPSLSRDILLMTRVDKPALLRQLFELGCAYSGQVLSYQKMLGQLQDAGNTTTLAHYLELLRGAGLLAGLQKYAGRKIRRRASSPKLLVLNTALMTAVAGPRALESGAGNVFYGHLVETAVGAFLLNGLAGTDAELFYWSSRNRELDFVLKQGDALVAIEVKSGRRRGALPGVGAFAGEHRVKRKLLVGGDGISLEEFFITPAMHWLD
ncbi:MAG: ATP-binding protein [Acidobacteriota bacterium]